MDKSIHEEYLPQMLQTNKKQYKTTATFLGGYKGTFNVTNKTNEFCFAKSVTDKNGFIGRTLPRMPTNLNL